MPQHPDLYLEAGPSRSAAETAVPTLARATLGGAVSRTIDLSELASPLFPHGPYVRFVKPVLDFVGALVLLILSIPIMLVVSVIVLVSLGHPIFLRQTRVGRDGRTFTVVKFRTMQPDRRRTPVATTTGLPFEDRRVNHKDPDDPRMTRAGALLRKLSLDEVPQLINVLMGRMSLVGPRPELPGIVDNHYQPWQHRRHDVKPGLTGLWQISERGNGMMHEHVDTDLDYIDSMSFTTDTRIILKTIPAALFSRRGR